MIGLIALTRALNPGPRLRAPDHTARLLATAAGCGGCVLAAVLAGAASRSPLDLLYPLSSVALLAIPAVMGFRTFAVAVLAAPAVIALVGIGVAEPPFDRSTLLVGVVALMAIVALLSVASASLLGPLRPVILAAAVGVTAALFWPAPLLIPLAAAPGRELGVLGAAVLLVLPFIAAPFLAWIEASRGMRAAGTMDVRDGLMRASGATAALLAGVWIASHAGAAADRYLVATPLEGLAVTAGWCAGAVVVLVVLWALWRVPRYFYQEQLRGRFYPRAISDAIWFLLIASSTWVAADIAIGGPTLGSTCWMALSAAVAYGAVRIAATMPPAPGASPLWIVVLHRPAWFGRAVVNRLVSAWTSGPVTILAPPDAAPIVAGAHLRASATSDRLPHLFPMRPSQLVDWDGGLPPPSSWHALPVRELYARPELWAETLGKRITPETTVIAISRWRPRLEHVAAAAFALVTDSGWGPKALWRALRGVAGMRGGLVKPSDAARLRPTMTAAELDAIATDDSYEVLHSRLAMMRVFRTRATRHILLLHHHGDREVAASVCEALAGRVDRVGMPIQPWPLRIDAGIWRRGGLWAVPVGFWSHGFVLARRVLDRSRGGNGRFWRTALGLLAGKSERDYDIAILEPAGDASRSSSLHRFFSLVLKSRAVGRMIVLRPIGEDRNVTPTLDVRPYTEEIRWSPGLTPQALAEEIASRLLDLRFTAAEGAEPPAEGSATAPEPDDTPVAAAAPSMSPPEPAEAKGGDLLDVYVALTPDVAVFREPLMDAFDHRRDLRRRISVVTDEALWFDAADIGSRWDEGPPRRSGTTSGSSGSMADARARLERADVYVLILGSSRWNLAQGVETLRADLEEARRRRLPCLVFQRRDEGVRESDSLVYEPPADVAERAAEFLTDVRAAHTLTTFSDYRDLLSLVFEGIGRVRNAVPRRGEKDATSSNVAVDSPAPQQVEVDVETSSARPSSRPAYTELPHEHQVLHARFRPDSGAIVTITDEAVARTWDALTREIVGVPIASVHDAEFSPDGRLLVSAGVDPIVRTWDPSNGRVTAYMSGHTDQITNATFSPNGARIVSASRDRTARLWNASSGELIGSPMQHDGAVVRALFGAKGKRILTCSEDHTAALWNGNTGDRLATATHSGAVRSGAFSADDLLVATASDDRTVRLWEVSQLAPFGAALQHEAAVTCVAFSPDGRWLATGCEDGVARISEGFTRILSVTRSLAHNAPVHWVACSPDSTRIATGCADGAVRFWHASSGSLLGDPVPLEGPVTFVEFSSSGNRLIAVDGSRSVKVLRA
jgi:WD40 repeat protein